MAASASHRCDVFISHASEDKEEFVRPLAAELTRLGLTVWYDELTLTLGDSLRQKIDEGLSSSRYGVVILSPSFFAKQWPGAELDALYAREMEGQKVILPIWHRVTKEQVLKHSPLLAGKLAMPTHQGVAAVAREIFTTVRPNVAPPVIETAHRHRPASQGEPQSTPLTELLRTVEDVAPLLHKLDESLEGNEARLFLDAMQSFFNGTNLLTSGTDSNLRYGADNLLRVLASADEHPAYLMGKISAARTCFEDFRKRMKVGDRKSVV